MLLARSGSAGQNTYVVDPEASAVTIHVGKSGIFGFAGHEHDVVAPSLRGEVVADDQDLARSSVGLTFDAAAMRITGRGEPARDVPKVQQVMAGPQVLDVGRYPTVTFRSKAVSGWAERPGAYVLRVGGDLAIHGVTREYTLPVAVTISGETLTAVCRTIVRQTHHGIRPVSVAGVVKVKDELTLDLRIVARLKSAD